MWKYLWLIHQGVSVELLIIILARMVWSEQSLIRFLLTVTPTITFLLLKIYSWFIIVAAVKQLKKDDKLKNFAAQWITNLIIASPYARLTFPAPDMIACNAPC